MIIAVFMTLDDATKYANTIYEDVIIEKCEIGYTIKVYTDED